MTELSVVEPGQLTSIVNIFAQLAWPQPRERMAAIADQIGWNVRRDSDSGMTADTGFAVTPPVARVLYDAGEIGEVTVSLTDRVRNPDAASRRALLAAIERVIPELSGLLGRPVSPDRGRGAPVTWDLSNGGRVSVSESGGAARLTIMQKRYADIERAEERLGISTDRDPHADL